MFLEEDSCVLRPIGVVSWGSIPYMLVGFIVLLIVLRFFSLKLVLSDNPSNTKEAKMEKTSTTRVMVKVLLWKQFGLLELGA